MLPPALHRRYGVRKLGPTLLPLARFASAGAGTFDWGRLLQHFHGTGCLVDANTRCPCMCCDGESSKSLDIIIVPYFCWRTDGAGTSM